ncbi:PREDICTED: putative nuclease HARBI1 [Rhagoletis zephyria]|uniref:putative nuclease HARBI1 n=1 Tax=Rhagoletis zephyria TaxID=28612 RepID=UPI000811A588|nr:PREDICTED: putative nuclease HARBI1 [Rhagoletis zephyria]
MLNIYPFKYLATGCTFAALALHFQRGERTIGAIVEETTKAVWDVLKGDYMKMPNHQGWKRIADRFYELWQLPNCLGAIDGKHIRIEQFPNSGSANYNYKNFHSIILLGCCDADGLFTSVECGFAGRNSDGGVFRISEFQHWLERTCDIPSPKELPLDESGIKFPYYYVADAAFPLRKNIMRPYPERNLDNRKRIFNYRLSRARKNIECTFGMMTQTFQIFMSPIRCKKYSTIISIVHCATVLHNYIRQKDGVLYSRQLFNSANTRPSNAPMRSDVVATENSSPQILRDYLSNYFLSPHAALPWQWKYCV